MWPLVDVLSDGLLLGANSSVSVLSSGSRTAAGGIILRFASPMLLSCSPGSLHSSYFLRR